MVRTIIGLTLAIGLLASASLTAKERLSRQCRVEIIKICEKAIKKRDVRSCIRENIDSISAGCRSEIADRVSARKNTTASKNTPTQRISANRISEYKYGSHERHVLNFKASKQNQSAATLTSVPNSTHRSIDDDARKSGSFAAQQIKMFLSGLL